MLEKKLLLNDTEIATSCQTNMSSKHDTKLYKQLKELW